MVHSFWLEYVSSSDLLTPCSVQEFLSFFARFYSWGAKNIWRDFIWCARNGVYVFLIYGDYEDICILGAFDGLTKS